jgi:hypothetical protein
VLVASVGVLVAPVTVWPAVPFPPLAPGVVPFAPLVPLVPVMFTLPMALSPDVWLWPNPCEWHKSIAPGPISQTELGSGSSQFGIPNTWIVVCLGEPTHEFNTSGLIRNKTKCQQLQHFGKKTREHCASNQIDCCIATNIRQTFAVNAATQRRWQRPICAQKFASAIRSIPD